VDSSSNEVVSQMHQMQEGSRQISENTSWELTIKEAPIARLESLDEIDQDPNHGV
jgi:hypothetical protein